MLPELQQSPSNGKVLFKEENEAYEPKVVNKMSHIWENKNVEGSERHDYGLNSCWR